MLANFCLLLHLFFFIIIIIIIHFYVLKSFNICNFQY